MLREKPKLVKTVQVIVCFSIPRFYAKAIWGYRVAHHSKCPQDGIGLATVKRIFYHVSFKKAFGKKKTIDYSNKICKFHVAYLDDVTNHDT